MSQMDLTQGNIRKTMMRFAVPFLLAILLQTCYGAADLIIVGQFCDSIQQSAVSTGTQVMNLLTNIIVGLATGATILVGQYTGEKSDSKVKSIIASSLTIFTLVSVVMSVVCAIIAPQMTALMNTPKESAPFATDYIFICSCGIFFIFGYNTISSILRGMGDSKNPLLFVAIACSINIGLDLALVPLIGAAGAALATIIAQGISMLMAIILLKKKQFIFDFKLKSFRANKKDCALLFKTGIPVAVQNSIVSLSFLIITSVANTYGVYASAAIGVSEKIVVFFMMPAIAFSMAVSSAVAQNIGARQIERAKQFFRFGLGISAIFSAIFMALLLLFPEILFRLFSNDAGVIEQACLYSKGYSIDVFLVAFVFCFNGFVNGTGKTHFTLINNVISTFGVRVPITLIISSMAGVTLFHLGFAAPIASVVQIVIIFIYYKSGRWNPERKLKGATL